MKEVYLPLEREKSPSQINKKNPFPAIILAVSLAITGCIEEEKTVDGQTLNEFPTLEIQESHELSDVKIHIQEFTDFQNEVLSSEIPVLVSFSSPWCKPCVRMEPFLERLAAEYTGEIKIGKLDFIENPKIVEEYNVGTIPDIRIFKDGKIVVEKEQKGYMDELELREMIGEIL